MDWLNIVSVVLGLVVGSFGAASIFVVKVGAITKELGELFVVLSDALDDKKLSKDELKAIIEEAKDVLEEFKK